MSDWMPPEKCCDYCVCEDGHSPLLARIEALEAQVRELEGHTQHFGPPFLPRPPGTVGGLPLPSAHQVTKSDFADPEARAALAFAAEAAGVQAQAILDELDDAPNCCTDWNEPGHVEH